MDKIKTRGLPHLPTDDLVLDASQIRSVHLEQLADRARDLADPYRSDLGPEPADRWWLGIDLADGHRITVIFEGDPVMRVFQRLEG